MYNVELVSLCTHKVCWKDFLNIDIPHPSNTFQLFLGDPEEFPDHVRYINHAECSGSTLGSPISWMPRKKWSELPRRHHDQMPKSPEPPWTSRQLPHHHSFIKWYIKMCTKQIKFEIRSAMQNNKKSFKRWYRKQIRPLKYQYKSYIHLIALGGVASHCESGAWWKITTKTL